jgi:DNA-binding MarR family transcriptional regulator
MTARKTEADLLDAMAASLENSLTHVFRPFRRQLLEAARARGLTMAQHTSMRLLSDGTACRMSDLADYLDLTNGAATALIEKLVDRGLVERLEDPTDKRAVKVALSAAGRALVDELKRVARQNLTERLATLSLAERHMVLGGVEALAESLRAP